MSKTKRVGCDILYGYKIEMAARLQQEENRVAIVSVTHQCCQKGQH